MLSLDTEILGPDLDLCWSPDTSTSESPEHWSPSFPTPREEETHSPWSEGRKGLYFSSEPCEGWSLRTALTGRLSVLGVEIAVAWVYRLWKKTGWNLGSEGGIGVWNSTA